MKKFLLTAAALMLAACAGGKARADFLSYYIGVDNLETLSGGTYLGQPNPNYNHLTFLYAHTYPDNPGNNHYHSKAILTYTGGAANPTAIRSASNYVPEGSIPPINLSAGSGIYAGKLVSNPYTDPSDPTAPFSDLAHGYTDSLAGFAPGSGEYVLHNSSSGRWNSPAAAAHLHAEIVSLTPGLNVGDATTLNLGGVGTELHLTDPGDLLDFTPVLWTDANAAPGTYEAVFRFFDEDGTFSDSGNVRFLVSVAPVPEPTTAVLGLFALAAGFMRRR